MSATRGWLAVLALGLLATGCSSASGGARAGASDAGGADEGVDSGGDDEGSADARAAVADAGPPQAYLRVAQLSPDLPAMDMCVAPHGTTGFQGPLLGQLAGTDAGVEAAARGLAYAQVSAYVALAPARYDVRIVPAGAPGCSSPSSAGDAPVDAAPTVADATDLPALAPDAFATLLVAGELQPQGGDHAFTVVVLSDDATVASGAASLRAVNAMPSAPSLDFGLGSFDAGWTPLFSGVAFAAVAAQAGPSAGMVDSNGYLPMAPLSAQRLSARASSGATSDLASTADLSIGLGATATVIAVGKAGDAAHPRALLLCTDNGPSGGILSDCGIQP